LGGGSGQFIGQASLQTQTVALILLKTHPGTLAPKFKTRIFLILKEEKLKMEN